MWLSLLKKYWFEIITILFVTYSTATIYMLKRDKEVLGLEKAQYAYALNFQNEVIVKNKADYDKAISKLPLVLTKIETKYKTQYEKIYAWRDKNETDCNDNLAFVNGFEF